MRLREMGWLLALAACSASKPSYEATIAEAQAAVREEMESTHATAVAVAIVDAERIVWSQATGSADREAQTAATTASLFGACSVSKMVASVAAMILVDRKLVSLDEPIATYLPTLEMPLDARFRKITLRMLLAHSSGLPGNDMRGAYTIDPLPDYPAQMMGALAVQRLKHDPGALHAYNNDGFTMIENLVAAVTGQGYPEFVAANVLKPLGMDSSRFQTVPLPQASYAKSYAGESLMPLYHVNVHASGGLFSNVEDLAQLARMFVDRGARGSARILSEDSVAEMAKDQRAGSFDPVPYDEFRFGLGWDTVRQPGLAAAGILAWQKTGDMGGYYGANLMVLPEEKLGVVVMGASNGFNSDRAVAISERVMLRALVERGRVAAMPSALSNVDRAVAAITASDKADFAGHYSSSNGTFRVSFKADDSLLVEELREDWTAKYQDFRLRDDGWYAADGDPHTALRFLTADGRRYLALRLKRGAGHYTVSLLWGQKLEERAAVAGAWTSRLSERWLPANTDTRNLVMSKSDPGLPLQTVPGLTGYLKGNNLLREGEPAGSRLDGMFLVAPDGVRDFQDVAVERHGSEDWLRAGTYLYRPLSGVPTLAAGTSQITLGTEGFAEWRRLPVTGSLTIGGASQWFLYDADLAQVGSGSGSEAHALSQTGPRYVVVYGAPGASITFSL